MDDFVSTSSKRQHVIEQLAQYAGQKKSQPNSTFIVCPFHAEQTPSGRIFHGPETRVPGYFRCYGCGAKHTWNELAPAIGLQPFQYQKPAEAFANLGLLPDVDAAPTTASGEALIMDEIRFSKLPPGKTWRGVSTDLLIDIGAKVCKVRHPEFGWLKPKLWLPIYVNKKLRGYIKARFAKHDEYPSYINAGGPWSKTHGLFPYDYAVKMAKRLGIRTIVLVEGPRDALRLLSEGVPAMCILGTQSWTATKTRILELSGITHVVLLMDGDDAGIQASSMLSEALQEMFRVVTLKLWAMKGSPYRQFKNKSEPSKAAKKAGVALWDPGNCPLWIINKIKARYFTPST